VTVDDRLAENFAARQLSTGEEAPAMLPHLVRTALGHLPPTSVHVNAAKGRIAAARSPLHK